MLRVDLGTKFGRGNLEEFTKQRGARIKYSVVYTPEQNKVIEIINKQINTIIRIIIIIQKLLRKLWSELYFGVIYILNRVLIRANIRDINITLIEAHTTTILGIPYTKPNVEYFRVLGCIYYIYLQEEQRLGKSFKYHLRT